MCIGKKLITLLLLITCYLGVHGGSRLEGEQYIGDPVEAIAVAEDTSIQPGRPFWIAVHLKVDNGWHVYWKNPGSTGAPTSVEWSLPDGVAAGNLRWPYPHIFQTDGMISYGYTGSVLLMTQIFPPKDLKPGENLDFTVDVHWIGCSRDSCVPGFKTLSLSLPIKEEVPQPNEKWAPKFALLREQGPFYLDGVSTRFKNNKLILHFEVPDFEAPVNMEITNARAYFFPVGGQIIDEQGEQHLYAGDGYYKLTLPLMKGGIGDSKNVRGVLVFSKGKETRAYDINVSVAETVISEKSSNNLLLFLLLAFVGGIILNFMPCVLPVVSLKVLNIVNAAKDSLGKRLSHALAFVVGLLFAFWVLSGLIIVLQHYGHEVGWGFQLQKPIFVAFLAGLFIVFALSLLGVFEIKFMGVSSSKAPRKHSVAGSFINGILATIVSTPCTGPLLGSVLGVAFTLHPVEILLIMTSIGIGMASPYLILGLWPRCLRFVPKPGPWMDVFKQVMGFLLILTVVWLIWIFGAQTTNQSVFMLMLGLFCVAISCWIYGRWTSVNKVAKTRVLARIWALIFICIGCVFAWQGIKQDTSDVVVKAEEWVPFDTHHFEVLRRQGKPVFVEFTAKWCLICQMNKVAFFDQSVEKKFNELGVVKMRADWTKHDSAITKVMKELGRNSVPLAVLYGTQGQEMWILPQILTPDIIISYLENLEKDKKKRNVD